MSIFKDDPKVKFCYKCGAELITYKKSGLGDFKHEEWLMLSCPSKETAHFTTIIKTWPKQHEYDVYTGRRLDGNSNSFRGEK